MSVKYLSLPDKIVLKVYEYNSKNIFISKQELINILKDRINEKFIRLYIDQLYDTGVFTYGKWEKINNMYEIGIVISKEYNDVFKKMYEEYTTTYLEKL